MIDLLVRITLVVLAVMAFLLAPIGVLGNLAGLVRGRVSAVDALGGITLILVAPVLLLLVALAGPGLITGNGRRPVRSARPLQPISNVT